MNGLVYRSYNESRLRGGRSPPSNPCTTPPGSARRSSWTFQESEVEGCEYEDDSYVHRQPFPEPVLEEQDIDRDDHGCHQDYVECGGRVASHFSPRLKFGAPTKRLTGSRIYRRSGEAACYGFINSSQLSLINIARRNRSAKDVYASLSSIFDALPWAASSRQYFNSVEYAL